MFASKDKHGNYATKSACQLGSCFDSCSLPATPPLRALVNAGEPNAHLVENLTTSGFVTAANGWSVASELDYNPWDATKQFGTAGTVAKDLVDPSFDTQPCP